MPERQVFSLSMVCLPTNTIQNKKRKYSHDDVDTADDAFDPLKNATTLYVGNLYVH